MNLGFNFSRLARFCFPGFLRIPGFCRTTRLHYALVALSCSWPRWGNHRCPCLTALRVERLTPDAQQVRGGFVKFDVLELCSWCGCTASSCTGIRGAAGSGLLRLWWILWWWRCLAVLVEVPTRVDSLAQLGFRSVVAWLCLAVGFGGTHTLS